MRCMLLTRQTHDRRVVEGLPCSTVLKREALAHLVVVQFCAMADVLVQGLALPILETFRIKPELASLGAIADVCHASTEELLTPS